MTRPPTSARRSPDADWWRGPLTELLGGRRVILAGGPAAQWTDAVGEVRQHGASDVLVVATDGRGAGPQPEAATVVVDGLELDDEMERIRAAIAAVGDPPAAVIDAVEAFDPDHTAVVVGSFLGEAHALCDRPFLAHRRPEWVALEDKTQVDALLDEAGVRRAPSLLVAVTDAADRRHQLDRGAGTVWAADASRGFHGGGTGTRWVVDDDEAALVAAELAGRCETVRIMPFLDGIATSIHGIVLPDGVAVLRPVELVTLRRGRDLVYAGCATFWDPPSELREEMRDAARRVAGVLRRVADFRGAFTLDGVATVDGFRPTELNPRNGAGLNVLAEGLPDVPLQLVLDLAVAGRDIGITAVGLEEALLASADVSRSGGTWQLAADPTAEIVDRPVSFADGAWSWAADDAPADGSVVAGGHFARCSFAPATTPIGASVGERSVAFWRFLDGEGITSLGRLTAPPDVTAPGER